MRVAGLDLGTNTFLCLIADVGPGAFKVLRDEVQIVRLGQGVNATHELHPEALARADKTLGEFSKFIKEAKCDRVLAVATSAARDVKNGDALLAIGRKYDIPIEIISGEKEAELTFAGSLESHWEGMTGIIDVGGGSTELIVGSKQGLQARVSADVGSVRMTELYGEDQEKIRAHVQKAMATALEKLKTQNGVDLSALKQVVAVAGTPTTLAAVDLGHAFESDIVHGHRFTLDRLDSWIAKLAKLTVPERQKLAGMEPKRADVIIAGAICLTESLKAFGQNEMTVSVRGLRYGVAQWVASRS